MNSSVDDFDTTKMFLMLIANEVLQNMKKITFLFLKIDRQKHKKIENLTLKMNAKLILINVEL